jgi:hypothetical protein
MVEGRNHTSGDSFIMVGHEEDADEDMYVSRDSGPAAEADLDFIAAARNFLPRLINEIVELRSRNENLGVKPRRRRGVGLGFLLELDARHRSRITSPPRTSRQTRVWMMRVMSCRMRILTGNMRLEGVCRDPGINWRNEL